MTRGSEFSAGSLVNTPAVPVCVALVVDEVAWNFVYTTSYFKRIFYIKEKSRNLSGNF
jgi:hypothetical protein